MFRPPVGSKQGDADESGPPKAIVASKFFALKSDGTPFQLYRKMLALLSVPLNLLEVGRVYRFNPGLTIRRIVLPAAAPSILMGLELSGIYAWLATIGAEYLLTSNGGIGAMMSSAQQTFMMDQVFVGIILSGLVGFSVTAGLDGLRRYVLRWKKSH